LRAKITIAGFIEPDPRDLLVPSEAVAMWRSRRASTSPTTTTQAMLERIAEGEPQLI
jgi:hypothetical protein